MIARRITAIVMALLFALLVAPVAAPGVAARAAAPAATAPFTPPVEWRTMCTTTRGAGSRLRAGANCRWLRLDGVYRRYVVVVPKAIAAAPNNKWPLVFMLHGHGGTGERMMGITDWIAVGTKAKVITVFPTSWRYRYVNGNIGTRWSTYQMTDRLDPSVRLDGYPDDQPYPTRDIELLRRIVKDVDRSIHVDPRRIHASGSSNGGQFMARVAVELADLVASVSCSGFCDAPPESAWAGITRPVPVLYGLGTLDTSVLALLADVVDPDPTAIPLRWSASRPMVAGLVASYLDAWRLETQPTSVTQRSTTTTVTWRTPRPKGTSGAVYRLVLLLGAHHLYPTLHNNHEHHSMAAISWSWFKAHPMP